MLLTLFCLCVGVLGCLEYVSVQNTSAAEDLSTLYLNMINGIRTRSYEMNTRDNLLYLIERSYINSTIIADSFPEVPDFGAYLRNASSYLAIYDHLDKLLLSPKSTVQPYY